MRKHVPGVLFGVLLLCGVVAVLAERMDAQPPTLIFGNNSGTVRQVAVDATGDLIVPSDDPCASASITKTTAVVDVTVDAILVTLTAAQTIHVCGFAATAAGTAPSLRFVSGTGAACATSQDLLSGVMLPTVGSPVAIGTGAATMIKGTVGEDLCLDVAGTTPSIQGVISFVKQ